MAGTQVAILEPKDTLRMLRKRDVEHRFVCLKWGAWLLILKLKGWYDACNVVCCLS